MSGPRESYTGNLGVALSIMLNAILGGRSREPFSARAWRTEARFLIWLIDGLHSPQHCYRSSVRSQAAEKARWAVDIPPLWTNQP